jgi:predicted DCC family thiol-disulfide oxidoreductase YuxK
VSDASAPPRYLVFFDGVCGLCDRSVQVFLRLDRRGVLRFAPLQGPTAAAVAARHPGSGAWTTELASIVFVTQTAKVDGAGRETLAFRSTAVLAILRAVGLPWSVFGTLGWVVPRFLRDAVYDWVGRHRYQWFGRFDTCRLPRPGDRERFLE